MTCSRFTGSDFIECVLGNLIAEQASSGRERNFNMFVDNIPITITPFQIQDLVCSQYGTVNANGMVEPGTGNYLAPCYSGRYLKDKCENCHENNHKSKNNEKCHDCNHKSKNNEKYHDYNHKSKKHKSKKHKSKKHKSKKH